MDRVIVVTKSCEMSATGTISISSVISTEAVGTWQLRVTRGVSVFYLLFIELNAYRPSGVELLIHQLEDTRSRDSTPFVDYPT